MWFQQTYKLPSNHETFLDRTLQEHLVDMYVNIFQAKPLEMHRQSDGELQFTDTGDPMVDRWEQELAEGRTPDLTETFAPGALEALDRVRSKSRASTIKEVMERAMRESAKIDGTEERGRQTRRRTFG